MSIRVTVKAIIVEDNKLLVIEKRNPMDSYLEDIEPQGLLYDLVGGGQEKYETQQEALKRECIEEIGCEVRVKDLVLIYEDITTNEQLRKELSKYAHKLLLIYNCERIDKKQKIEKGINEDLWAVGIKWIDLEKEEEINRILPLAIRRYIKTINANL